MIFIRRFISHWSMNVVGKSYTTFYPLLINKHLSSYQPPPQKSSSQAFQCTGKGVEWETRRSVECMLMVPG